MRLIRGHASACAFACALAVSVVGSGVARAERVIALAPLAVLGAEATTKETKQVATALETALARPGVKVVGTTEVVAAIKRAKQPQLRACDGDTRCLADLGALVGATDVVFAELGGLGDAQVVYLTLIDVAKASEVRSTSLEVGAGGVPVGGETGGARGAAVRLLDPERYVGKLAIEVDVPGAAIYVNGRGVGKSPLTPLSLPVGTHAVRVTHPEFRDFVRFVDVHFDQTEMVPVGLHQFPVIQTNVDEKVGPASAPGNIRYIDPPWYRRWWALAAGGAILAGMSAIVAAKAADDRPEPDHTRPL